MSKKSKRAKSKFKYIQSTQSRDTNKNIETAIVIMDKRLENFDFIKESIPSFAE